ncbi:MAG TPA: hypothetical protein PL070_07320 [Flavobacteriales bacterium]|nr:hypothetical protein [Flavobacteriales bacterium]
MKYTSHVLLILFVVVFGHPLVAQDRILLMNGETVEGKVLGQSTLEVRYLQTRKNGTVRERAEPTEEVFSVTAWVGSASGISMIPSLVTTLRWSRCVGS